MSGERTREPDDGFGSEFVETERFEQLWHLFPVRSPGYLRRRILLQELPEHWNGHFPWWKNPVSKRLGWEFSFCTIHMLSQVSSSKASYQLRIIVSQWHKLIHIDSSINAIKTGSCFSPVTPPNIYTPTHATLLTWSFIEKYGGNEKLPWIMEECFLDKIERRTWRSPFSEGLPSGCAGGCTGATQEHLLDRKGWLYLFNEKKY